MAVGSGLAMKAAIQRVIAFRNRMLAAKIPYFFVWPVRRIAAGLDWLHRPLPRNETEQDCPVRKFWVSVAHVGWWGVSMFLVYLIFRGAEAIGLIPMPEWAAALLTLSLLLVILVVGCWSPPRQR